MISSSKLFVFTISLICVLNGALGFIPQWLRSECSHQVEPANPEMECKYGYAKNSCEKIYCLKGPDEKCKDEGRRGQEHCHADLRCCGICTGCIKSTGECSTRMCTVFSAGKRVPSKSVWFPDFYQQQDENSRLLPRSPLMPQNFINFKNPVDRLQYYPFNNNFEYLNNDD